MKTNTSKVLAQIFIFFFYFQQHNNNNDDDDILLVLEVDGKIKFIY